MIYFFDTSLSLSHYIYMSLAQVTSGVTLSNVAPLNNLLLNSYIENPTVGFHFIYLWCCCYFFFFFFFFFTFSTLNVY